MDDRVNSMFGDDALDERPIKDIRLIEPSRGRPTMNNLTQVVECDNAAVRIQEPTYYVATNVTRTASHEDGPTHERPPRILLTKDKCGYRRIG
jgi:hypothetical protein